MEYPQPAYCYACFHAWFFVFDPCRFEGGYACGVADDASDDPSVNMRLPFGLKPLR